MYSWGQFLFGDHLKIMPIRMKREDYFTKKKNDIGRSIEVGIR